MTTPLACSFCGRNDRELMIQNPPRLGDALICDMCVACCVGLINFSTVMNRVAWPVSASRIDK
jgi:hypothetical protein